MIKLPDDSFERMVKKFKENFIKLGVSYSDNVINEIITERSNFVEDTIGSSKFKVNEVSSLL
jgi:hypothetical protein